MKLLTRKEIDALKNKERQLEVDEGLKIARRVDSLREIAAQEETALKNFREKTIENINKDIDKETKRLEELRSEVISLERRRSKALESLEEEWGKLNQDKEDVQKKIKEFDALEGQLNSKDISLSERERDILNKEREIDSRNKISQQIYNDAVLTKDEAGEESERAIKILLDTRNKCESLSKNLGMMESELEQREIEVSQRERELKDKEIQIMNEWTVLRDRQARLIKNIKKFNK